MALAAVFFMAIFVAAFGALLVYVASKVGPKLGPGQKTDNEVKLASYECGIEVQEKSDTKISVKFYLTAILFIIFDIEIIFMYPWAITFREFMQTDLAMPALISMSVFLLIFIFGLFWEIKSKALEWE